MSVEFQQASEAVAKVISGYKANDWVRDQMELRRIAKVAAAVHLNAVSKQR